MNFLNQALTYIFTASNWGGKAGLGARILEHLQYTAVAVIASALVAIPIGMIIGHTRRGTFLVVTGVNALRALPTLGVLLLAVLLWVGAAVLWLHNGAIDPEARLWALFMVVQSLPYAAAVYVSLVNALEQMRHVQPVYEPSPAPRVAGPSMQPAQ